MMRCLLPAKLAINHCVGGVCSDLAVGGFSDIAAAMSRLRRPLCERRRRGQQSAPTNLIAGGDIAQGSASRRNFKQTGGATLHNSA
jgi:hypothetical protein